MKIISIISGLMLLVGTSIVQAQVATVSGTVNLRQGPGTNYTRIAALPRGAAVHIESCRGSWCQIRSSWGIGWISGRYLSQSYQGYNAAPVYNTQPQVTFGLNIGSDFYDDPFYAPYYQPYYTGWHPPYYRPWYRPGYRPYGPRYNPRPFGRQGWNPRWGVGPVHFPRGGWRR
ncbi:SH3 domain-containing protein [Ochrobactrum sp. GRS2]|nr:SH3 domain-containing protein [Ochrobactrum sp. GRS2]